MRDLLFLILAIWRVTYAINKEKIGEPIKKAVGVKTDSFGLESFPDTFFANLVMCFRCLSVWVSVAMTLLWVINPLIIYPFALSFIVIKLNEKFEG
jgi:hypothetical protein